LGKPPDHGGAGQLVVDAARALVVTDSISARTPHGARRATGPSAPYAAATARIGAADAARLPTISIVGSFGSQAGGPANLFGDQTRVYQAFAGIHFPYLTTLAWPARRLPRGRGRSRRGRRYEGTVLNALREASDALVGVRSARDQAVAQATQANALRQALDLAEIRYQAGLATYLDLLDAQRSLFNAELALSQSQLGELLAAVQLYKALGGSWMAGESTATE